MSNIKNETIMFREAIEKLLVGRCITGFHSHNMMLEAVELFCYRVKSAMLACYDKGFKDGQDAIVRECYVESVKRGTLYDVWRYTCCGYEHSESNTDTYATSIPMNYCPNCGARVIN